MGNKTSWRPGTMVYPLPAVLVSCGSTSDSHNLITVSWTGTICSDPAMLYISVRPQRHSYDIIKREMMFTVNLTTADMARKVDWCGVKSGRDYDKWTECDFTPAPGIVNTCPYVAESPLAIECRVKSIVPLGTHDMFVAQVMNVIADEDYIDPVTGAFDMVRAGMLVYCHGGYYNLGEYIGHFGFSVKKKAHKSKRQ